MKDNFTSVCPVETACSHFSLMPELTLDSVVSSLQSTSLVSSTSMASRCVRRGEVSVGTEPGSIDPHAFYH